MSQGFRGLINRRLGRRGMFRASGAGVATAVIVGLGQRVEAAHAFPAAMPPGAPPRSLMAVDPHASTGMRSGHPQGLTGGARLRVMPIARARFLAGARFDLRIEATGVDPDTARIELSVTGPRGPEPLLRGEPVRTSSSPDSLEVTYRELSYGEPGAYTVRASLTDGDQPIEAAVNHDVVLAASTGKQARNVIFFLGDGMGAAPITPRASCLWASARQVPRHARDGPHGLPRQRDHLGRRLDRYRLRQLPCRRI